MKLTAEVRGGFEIAAVLKNLPPDVERKLTNQALRAGARVIRNRARQLVPVKSGLTKKAIVVRSADRRSKARGAQIVVGVLRNRANIGRFLELGTVRQNAQPFLRPAVDETKTETVRAIAASLDKGIKRQVKALSSRFRTLNKSQRRAFARTR